jgi:hypothetical protein
MKLYCVLCNPHPERQRNIQTRLDGRLFVLPWMGGFAMLGCCISRGDASLLNAEDCTNY